MSRGRLALLLILPVVILAIGGVRGCRYAASGAGDPRERLASGADHVVGRLDAFAADALRVARAARDTGATEVPAGMTRDLGARFEGAAALRGGAFTSWIGTPAEPEEFGATGEAVRLVRRGVRTSLLARTADDASGSAGAASFVFDIRSGGMTADELLESGNPAVAVRWSPAPPDEAAIDRYDAGPPASLRRAWRAPDGRALADVVVEERPGRVLAARARAASRAWAAFALTLSIGLALLRRAAPVGAGRLAAVVGGAIVARASLAAGRTFEELLPRSLGSASLYGRGQLSGLLGSPAALAATALAFYVIASTLARWAAGAVARGKRLAVLPLLLLTAAGVAASIALAGSLARDARVSVPRLDPSAVGPLLLAIAAALVLTGTAEAAATLVAALAGRRTKDPHPGRLAVAACLVPLSVVALAHLHRTADRVVEDRLRSEFAPLVLEQSARRRIALTSAVAEASSSPAVAGALTRGPGSDDPFLAYEAWVGSDLFHQGFASSLDLYDAGGARRGHFEFAFPQVGGVREAAPRPGPAGGGPAVELETVPIGSSMLHVVHAETPVTGPDGAIIGRVVGHVLEDPSNLPFLPGSAPYLDALGRGPAATVDPSGEAPDYVLFDEDGRVDLSTVHQPPAPSAALRDAAAAGRRIEVDGGDTRYRALPLADGPRLHLLMTPAPTLLDAAGDAVRLILVGLAVIALTAVFRMLSRPGGVTALADVVRGSFRRKLLAALLVASVVPLVGLAVFLRAYIERRSEANLDDAAATVVGAAQRVVEDYQSVGEDDPGVPPLRLNDEALSWLRRVVGQEIHLYEAGEVAATSKPELFDSGLQLPRLPGEVDRAVVRGGRPFLVRRERLGKIPLPVAYAPVDVRGGPRDAVIGVPLVLEQRAFVRSVDRLVEILLLLTTALVGTLAVTSALLARSVAGPVRRLADASRRIAGGDYGTRLTSTSRDEMGTLVGDFNLMAQALADQRADLTRRRDYIEALLSHATTGVVSTGADGRIVTINPAAQALLGGGDGPPARGDLLEGALRRNHALAPLAAALARAASPDDPIEVDVGGREATARLRLVRVPLPDPAGGDTGTLVLLDDVTSLMKSNQLAAWAEMARAIAHEIKNPLTPIQLSAEHARRLLTDRGILPSPELDACLDTIVRQVRELREISGAFSAYAKIPDLVLASIDPSAFLGEIATPYRAAPPPGVRIEERFTDVPPILADRRILARAVINLVENALQAMPRGGVLRLATAVSGPDVILEVGDDGPGLAPEIRARLFEPYFSTKSAGTGLGLAIARRAVEAHGGTIELESGPGVGTTFRIRVPARVILRP
jgi:signal transduction histidine kinase/HAMP domain-containing protein